MPSIPSFINSHQTSVTFVDSRGQTRSVLIERPSASDTVLTNTTALLEKMSGMSNGAIFKRQDASVGVVSIASVTAFDEAESSVNTVAVLVFRKPDNSLAYLELPAPDAQFLDSTGDALDVGLLDVTELIGAYNAINPTHVFERSFIASRKGTKARTGTKPQIAEPGLTDEPGGLPSLTP